MSIEHGVRGCFASPVYIVGLFSGFVFLLFKVNIFYLMFLSVDFIIILSFLLFLLVIQQWP